MTENGLALRENGASIVEQVVIAGDLGKLAPAQRVAYYQRTCESLGLNPLTQPFQYITLNGKLTLYCTRAATDQLRALRKVSLTITARETVGDLYVVTARATTPDGRTDESIGAVSIAGLRGDALANAYMKAETKAKRRVTLAVVGLGWLDESEMGSIPGAQTIAIEDVHAEQRAPEPPAPVRAAPQPPTDAPDLDDVDGQGEDDLDRTLREHAAPQTERTDAAWLDYEVAYKAAIESGMSVPKMREDCPEAVLRDTAGKLRRAVNARRPAR